MSDVHHLDASIPAAVATKPEERLQRSLFGEILDWMLVPLLLLWPMSIAITYLVAKSIANYPFDRALDDRVTVLAQQVKEDNGKVVMQLPGPARDILRADDVDNVYYQVLGPHGEYVDGDLEMPTPPADDDDQHPKADDAKHGNATQQRKNVIGFQEVRQHGREGDENAGGRQQNNPLLIHRPE